MEAESRESEQTDDEKTIASRYISIHYKALDLLHFRKFSSE